MWVIFQNAGTFRKSAAAGSTTLLSSGSSSIAFNTTGLVDVESGSLVISCGGSGGNFNAVTNTTLTFSGGFTFGNGSTFSGPGSVIWSSGAFTVNGTINFQNLQQTGGSMNGGNIVLNGPFTWTAGNWNGAAIVTLPATAQLNIVSGNDHDMANCVLTNLGTVTWTGGRIRGGSYPGTIIYNLNLWNVQCDQALNSDYSYNGTIFNNSGTFRKTVTTGSTTVNASGGLGAIFNDTGTVDLETGALVLTGGGVFNGGAVTGGGNLFLNAGYYNFNGTVMSTNVQQTGGLLYGSNLLVGGFTWSGGNWNSASAVTLAANSELDIVSGADHDLVNCAFNNLGNVEWRGGRIRGGGNPGTTISNNGVWEAQCDQPLNSDYALNGLVFKNAGTFRKSLTLGTTTVASSGGLGVTFTDLGGTIELDSGTLSLPGSFVVNGPLTIAVGGNGAGQFGQLAVAGVATLGAPLTVNVVNGFAPAISNQFRIVSGLNGGFFNPPNIPAYATLLYTNLNNAGVYLVITGLPRVQILNPQPVGGNFDFGFQTVNNQSYTIQENTNLVTGAWLFYTNIIGNGSITNFAVPVTPDVPQLFFRVRQP